MRVRSSAPGGISIVSWRVWRSSPWPWHLGHGAVRGGHAAAAAHAEEDGEDVGEAAEPLDAGARPAGAAVDSLLAVAVVARALLGIGDHLVGAVDLLEPLRGVRIAAVHVR